MTARSLADLQKTYEFEIHQDLRSFRLRPFWATGTLGIGHLGYAGGGIWRGRTRARLEARVRRWAIRDALSRGNATPIIKIAESRP
jgi:hypothetical protein